MWRLYQDSIKKDAIRDLCKWTLNADGGRIYLFRDLQLRVASSLLLERPIAT